MQAHKWLSTAALLGCAAAASAAPKPGRISEITLQRTPCFGRCPVDRVTLRSDGTATYQGERFVDRLGVYKGRFAGFEKLAAAANTAEFRSLKGHYASAATDLPSHIITVVSGGKRRTISDYGHVAPEAFQQLDRQIIATLGRIRWTKTGEAPNPSKPAATKP
jgi:hypothetical protein